MQPALILLGAAVAMGLALVAIPAVTERPPRQIWVVAAAHGLLGAGGSAAFFLVFLRHAAAGGFGPTALLLAATLLAAGWPLSARLRGRKVPGVAIAVHASLGFGAAILLTAAAASGRG